MKIDKTFGIQRVLTLLLALLVLMGCLDVGAFAANVPYEYIDANGKVQSCTTYKIVNSSTTKWTSGWYVVRNNVRIKKRIVVSGDVHLILDDKTTLNARKGINVSGGNSLTIYAASTDKEKRGSLKATGAGDDAGIGGNYHGAGGTITINGGEIEATGGIYGGAGIGGGKNAPGGAFTINGGYVNAESEYGGAGIGGGYGQNGAGGTITFNGGEVISTSYSGGAGIGGGCTGPGGTITINGGMVHAQSNGDGAGIGGGAGQYGEGGCPGGTITINGGEVYAYSHTGAAGIGSNYRQGGATITINGGNVTVPQLRGYNAGIGYNDDKVTLSWTNPTDSIHACGFNSNVTVADGKSFLTNDKPAVNIPSGVVKDKSILKGKKITPSIPVMYRDENGVAQQCTNYTAVAASNTLWSSGWYVLNSDVTFDHNITVDGDVRLILADNMTLKAKMGITVEGDNSLTVYAQSAGKDSTGELIAYINENGGAGISGGGSFDVIGGEVEINGGTVFALPTSLDAIEDGAFEGIAAQRVEVAKNVVSIGPRAFANCPNLIEIIIPATVQRIDDTALQGSINAIVFGSAGSEAQRFANENRIPFIAAYPEAVTNDAA